MIDADLLVAAPAVFGRIFRWLCIRRNRHMCIEPGAQELCEKVINVSSTPANKDVICNRIRHTLLLIHGQRRRQNMVHCIDFLNGANRVSMPYSETKR